MEPELPNLPDEIIFNILSRIPVKPLCRFKSVSKPWLALITDPHFIKSHLNQSTKHNQTQKLILAGNSFYSVDYQSPNYTVAELEVPCKSNVELMGSFNGILLLHIDDELCLWNPTIRMYRKFPQPKYPGRDMLYGLGYDYVCDDFKVVRVAMSKVNAPCDVHMFNSKLSSWKWIGEFDYTSYLDRPGIVLNGMPHWILNRCTIVCFDVTEEKFKEVPKPNWGDEGDENGWLELGLFGGCLCVLQNHADRGDFWVLEEYGVKESWTKLFALPKDLGEVPECSFCLSEQLFCSVMHLCYANDGEVVMLLDLDELVIYNPKENRHMSIEIPRDDMSFEVAFYVESLVSPHGGGSGLRHR